MKLYMFVVVLFVSFMIGCGGGEKNPAADPQPGETGGTGEVVEEVVEIAEPSSGELETLPEPATEKPEEEVDTGLIDSGISIDPVAPAPGGGEPAVPAGGGEPPAAAPGTGVDVPAPAAPATDPLAPAPATGAATEPAATEPATDPLAPAPAAGAATDPVAPPPAEPAAEPAAAAPTEPASAIRIWTDASGTHKIEAEFVSFKDGTVTLKKADGKLTLLPLDRLSQADRDHVKSLNP